MSAPKIPDPLFDRKHQVMQHGSEKPGVRRLCYAGQADFIESALQAGITVLDIGCGPKLPYARSAPCTIVGLDPSFESIRANDGVDVRIYGYAGNMPIAEGAVDAVLALYAVHHFGGRNRAENIERVSQAFKEFDRVVKPDGNLFVFEVEPWAPAWFVQCALWNTVRKVWPAMDIFFWRERPLRAIAESSFTRATTFERRRFHSPMLNTFAPVFAFPDLKLPRFAYPFHINLYHWRFA